jgi:hypothetical protein
MDDQTTEPPGWYVKPASTGEGDAQKQNKNEPYDCPKCKRKHYRGKIYDEHRVHFTDQ